MPAMDRKFKDVFLHHIDRFEGTTVFVISQEFTFLLASSAGEKGFDYDIADVKAQKVEDVLNGKLRPVILMYAKRCFKYSKEFLLRKRIVGKILDFKFIPFFEGDKVGTVTVIIENVSKQSRMLDAIEKAAWVTAHRLRGPLARVLGLLSIFNTDNLSAEQIDLLDKMLVSALEADKMVKDTVINLNEASE